VAILHDIERTRAGRAGRDEYIVLLPVHSAASKYLATIEQVSESVRTQATDFPLRCLVGTRYPQYDHHGSVYGVIRTLSCIVARHWHLQLQPHTLWSQCLYRGAFTQPKG
jgi:hypothetical protein